MNTNMIGGKNYYVKKYKRLLSLLLLISSCNFEEAVPNPTLGIEFGYLTNTDCCITTNTFANQDSIYYQNVDSSIVVSIQENYLTNPQIIGGNSKRGDEFIYTFVVQTNQGDREVFVSNKNVWAFSSGWGDSSIGGVWVSEMINNFIVPISYKSTIIENNGIIEIDSNSAILFTIIYVSQFSSLSIEDSIEIQP